MYHRLPVAVQNRLFLLDRMAAHAARASVLFSPKMKDSFAHLANFPAHYAGIDSDLKTLITLKNAKGQETLLSHDVDYDRRRFDRIAAVREKDQTRVAQVQPIAIPRSDGSVLHARLYTPYVHEHTVQPIPLVLYFHGGAYVVGNLDTCDEPCRMLCHYGEFGVLSVDYRLAPEHKAPAQLEDALLAFAYAKAQATVWGFSAQHIGVSGDSAGGNLTALLCQHLVMQQAPLPAAQLLIYPWVDLCGHYYSRDAYTHGLFLSVEDIDRGRVHLIGESSSFITDCRRHSPLLADATILAQQPRTLVVTSEFDVLRDEGEAYHSALQTQKVPSHLTRITGQCHGFFNMTHLNRAARFAAIQVAKDFRLLLNNQLI